MISFIKGFAKILKEDTIIIENNGIGYKVFVTQSVFNYINSISNEMKVYTYMNINENEISLFGFLNLEELRIFERLITVSGVGPKSAISLLNCLKPSEIALSIITSDIKQLSKGQGIGKKTAERIALELKDKIETFETLSNIENIKSADEDNNINKIEAIEGLIALGFSRAEAVSSVNKIKEDLPSDKIIVLALKTLSI